MKPNWLNMLKKRQAFRYKLQGETLSCRQLGACGLQLSLNSSLLGRTATVVRQRGNVFDRRDLDTRLSQCTNGTFSTGTRALYKYIHSLYTRVDRYFRSVAGSH